MDRTPHIPFRDIHLDVDGVLLDWLGGFRPHAEAALGRRLDPAGPETFCMQSWCGLSERREVLDLIVRFNGSPGFGRLQPMPGAQAAVAQLVERGHLLHVVSSCAEDDLTRARRISNLEEMFGPVFASVRLLGLGAPKAPFLAGAEVLVEDHPGHAADAARLGLRSFLLEASYNRAVPVPETVTRVARWQEVVENLCPEPDPTPFP